MAHEMAVTGGDQNARFTRVHFTCHQLNGCFIVFYYLKSILNSFQKDISFKIPVENSGHIGSFISFDVIVHRFQAMRTIKQRKIQKDTGKIKSEITLQKYIKLSFTPPVCGGVVNYISLLTVIALRFIKLPLCISLLFV
jgi:hypothetical protein